MGPVKVFKTPEYTVKQPPDPVVCRTPSNGILCAPSASGKTVLLVSMILEQYRGCFERVYIMSNSIDTSKNTSGRTSRSIRIASNAGGMNGMKMPCGRSWPSRSE